jgi:hypothetical protein
VRNALAVVLALGALFTGCHGGLPAHEPELRRAPTYRPGQSIAESRVCECRECFQAKCCSGDVDSAGTAAEGELGITLDVCSRCVRRVWTVRNHAPCETLAPPECCPSS